MICSQDYKRLSTQVQTACQVSELYFFNNYHQPSLFPTILCVELSDDTPLAKPPFSSPLHNVYSSSSWLSAHLNTCLVLKRKSHSHS